MSDAELVTYEQAMGYPIGTVVEDAVGYWAGLGRRYVKTGEARWAVFFRAQPWSEHADAIEAGRNNLSPCPSGYMARVTLPADIPGFEGTWEALADLRVSDDVAPGGSS